MLYVPDRVRWLLDAHFESYRQQDFAAAAHHFAHPLPVWQDGSFLVLTTPADIEAWQADMRGMAKSLGTTELSLALLEVAERPEGRLILELRIDYQTADGFPAYTQRLRYYFSAESDAEPKIVMVETLATNLPRG